MAPPSRRIQLQRRYWFGPVADFFITLGYVALGQGSVDFHPSAWLTEPLNGTELQLAPLVFHALPSTWRSQGYPPLRARLLEDAEPPPAPK